ncbi:glucose/galactose transporter [Colletotrichum abscissum]|uniref:Glucose/galactose transporter n=4 Tax=Colletotrichum acutatum species complex TaxID=2707335 RepID=A0A9Q0AZU7_9PEZI|nr:glucose/galactose transporter [Colletotrichum costaricense]XP_060386650.1 glucose/galactose transporter [Colletotrichum tamarilloi]XP_060391729.1 glucose/galactose transporter [Colletotrichum abscissum]KAK1447650.1 glucose/galactose transporter [Colletotrichum melonis]KAI3539258.1 glucose/galactose transporter [Colletotrichum abscissum]KAK1475943.1 glucose/galactose transporter [Colletotrichum abscissum]KAK1507697.1 glucose/galactose transporter [Colletotrichum tamarilloi]KAK1533127.1 glu
MFGKRQEPDVNEVLEQRRPSTAEATAQQHRKNVSNKGLTGASALTVKQSIVPITLVTVLFFLWGFAYGLLDVLNSKFQIALNITAAKAGGLQGAYFGAYFIGPLTYSGWIVRKFGYRWTFITGLCIYGVGALMFWPSAVYRSFPGFCGSLFIVGSGLSTLETSANPFIATCGPPRLSEFRLELSQSFQAVGSVIAPLLAARVFFSHTEPNDLSKVQWTYLGIAAFVFLLAVVFFVVPLPEITDSDMALQAEMVAGEEGHDDKPLRKQYRLFFGVAAQFCYVGAQVAVASQFISYAVESAGLTHSEASDRYAIGQGLFAIGRFAAAGLMMVIKPRLVLMVFMTGIMIFIALAIGIKGEGGIAMLSIVLFFESCIFPTIFTTAIRGLGRHTKRGSSWIVASVCGGALFPSLTGLVADTKGYHISMVVPLAGFVVSLAYPIFLNTVWKKDLDSFSASKIGNTDEHGVIGDPARDDAYGDKAASKHLES